MTIRVFRDRIQLGDFTLTTTPTGFSFDGGIAAANFSQGSIVGKHAGFVSGGFQFNPLLPYFPTIIRYPFANITGRVEAIGELGPAYSPTAQWDDSPSSNSPLAEGTGISSGDHGYVSTKAGYIAAGPPQNFPSNPFYNPGGVFYSARIDRFPFSNFSPSVVHVGGFAQPIGHSGQTHVKFPDITNQNGYFMFSNSPYTAFSSVASYKFPFSSDAIRSMSYMDRGQSGALNPAPPQPNTIPTPLTRRYGFAVWSPIVGPENAYILEYISDAISPPGFPGNWPGTMRIFKFPFATESKIVNIPGVYPVSPVDVINGQPAGGGPNIGFQGLGVAFNSKTIGYYWFVPGAGAGPPTNPNPLFLVRYPVYFPFATESPIVGVIDNTAPVWTGSFSSSEDAYSETNSPTVNFLRKFNFATFTFSNSPSYSLPAVRYEGIAAYHQQ
jgi:hypothetical protein